MQQKRRHGNFRIPIISKIRITAHQLTIIAENYIEFIFCQKNPMFQL